MSEETNYALFLNDMDLVGIVNVLYDFPADAIEGMLLIESTSEKKSFSSPISFKSLLKSHFIIYNTIKAELALHDFIFAYIFDSN